MTADPYAPFRPRLARVVTLSIGALTVVGTVALIVGARSWLSPPDQVGFGLVGAAVAWFCWRQASVRADVDASGLTVRNLLLTRRLAWAQVVEVRFGQGRPWVQLDLADGDTLAVMGIQRADGTVADAQARRLATLLARHTATEQDD